MKRQDVGASDAEIYRTHRILLHTEVAIGKTRNNRKPRDHVTPVVQKRSEIRITHGRVDSRDAYALGTVSYLEVHKKRVAYPNELSQIERQLTGKCRLHCRRDTSIMQALEQGKHRLLPRFSCQTFTARYGYAPTAFLKEDTVAHEFLGQIIDLAHLPDAFLGTRRAVLRRGIA